MSTIIGIYLCEIWTFLKSIGGIISAIGTALFILSIFGITPLKISKAIRQGLKMGIKKLVLKITKEERNQEIRQNVQQREQEIRIKEFRKILNRLKTILYPFIDERDRGSLSKLLENIEIGDVSDEIKKEFGEWKVECSDRIRELYEQDFKSLLQDFENTNDYNTAKGGLETIIEKFTDLAAEVGKKKDKWGLEIKHEFVLKNLMKYYRFISQVIDFYEDMSWQEIEVKDLGVLLKEYHCPPNYT